MEKEKSKEYLMGLIKEVFEPVNHKHDLRNVFYIDLISFDCLRFPDKKTAYLFLKRLYN